MKNIIFVYIFFSVFFVSFTEFQVKTEPPVSCAGIMCNDEDFFFYNYNNYLYFPIIELGGN